MKIQVYLAKPGEGDSHEPGQPVAATCCETQRVITLPDMAEQSLAATLTGVKRETKK